VERWLRDAGAPPELVRAVRDVAAPSAEEERRIFGESLPPGLSLVDEEEEGAPAPGGSSAPAGDPEAAAHDPGDTARPPPV
jgi:hypothetical protein